MNKTGDGEKTEGAAPLSAAINACAQTRPTSSDEPNSHHSLLIHRIYSSYLMKAIMVQRIILRRKTRFSVFFLPVGCTADVDWGLSPASGRFSENLDLGMTTVDHADIYGGYRCSGGVWQALKPAPHLP